MDSNKCVECREKECRGALVRCSECSKKIMKSFPARLWADTLFAELAFGKLNQNGGKQ